MKMTLRHALMSIFITGLCALFAICGFAYGSYVQFSHIVFLNQAALGKNILMAQICAQQGCDKIRGVVKSELPLLTTNYSLQYELLHKSFPRNIIIISKNAWESRHSVDGAIKPPYVFQDAIKNVSETKNTESK